MIIPRNGERPPGSLQDRLLSIAEVAHKRAEDCPVGPEREKLLRKAEQSERTAAIEAWITAPGSLFPE